MRRRTPPCTSIWRTWPLLGLALLAVEIRAAPAVVTDRDFNVAVVDLSTTKPVVVEFFAEWCSHCRPLAVILDDLSRTYGSRVEFVRVDIDSSPALADRFGVDGIPVVYVFDAGLPLARASGLLSRTELQAMIDAFLDPGPRHSPGSPQ